MGLAGLRGQIHAPFNQKEAQVNFWDHFPLITRNDVVNIQQHPFGPQVYTEHYARAIFW